MRFRQIRSKSHRIEVKYRRNLGFFTKIQKTFARILKFLPKSMYLLVSSGFLSFKGGKLKLKLTRQSRFLVVKTRRRPLEQSGWPASNHIQLVSWGWLGLWMILDSPHIYYKLQFHNITKRKKEQSVCLPYKQWLGLLQIILIETQRQART